MVETTSWINCDDGAKLFVRRFAPEKKPITVIQIVHGMAEHSLRYRRLAKVLCSSCFEVWVGDMRGHGKTADLSINGPDKGGLLGHCADKDGFSRVVSDLLIIAKHIIETTKKEYGDPTTQESGELPLFILGHSWGSFLVQAFIESYGSEVPLKGCILSGTRGPGGIKIAMGAPLVSLIATLKGARKISKISIALSSGSYNKPFKPNRTSCDWLSRDEKEVDAYIADPFCGFPCSAGFYRDMIGAFKVMHKKDAIARIHKDLPIYIFCGSADPVGDMSASSTALVNAYRREGINDLEFVLYPEARHETLNETNRDEVTDDLLNWLLRRVH